jgi:hypothetical protein
MVISNLDVELLLNKRKKKLHCCYIFEKKSRFQQTYVLGSGVKSSSNMIVEFSISISAKIFVKFVTRKSTSFVEMQNGGMNVRIFCEKPSLATITLLSFNLPSHTKLAFNKLSSKY